MVRPPLYGLDIVTEVTAPSEPIGERVVAVGLSMDGCDQLFEGDEPELLADLDEMLVHLPPGVLVSWQGGIVDLPVLGARARAVGLEVGLRLRRDARDRRHSPVAGVGAGYCGAWHRHRHLDLARVYDGGGLRVGRVLRGRNSEDLIPPADERTVHDPRRDAHLARCLAERRWNRARRLVDRMPPTPGSGGIFAPVLDTVRQTS